MRRYRITTLVGCVFGVLTVSYIITTLVTIEKRKLAKFTLIPTVTKHEDFEVDHPKNETFEEHKTKLATLGISFSQTKILTNSCDSRTALKGHVDVEIRHAEVAYWTHLGLVKPEKENTTSLGNFTSFANATWGDVAVFHGPINKTTAQRIAIIVPFRDREQHLRILLGHLLPVLQRQGNIFSIFVVEQFGEGTFNKGRVMNSGFKYASSIGDRVNSSFDCFIFHDVDLLVENDNLMYRCSSDNDVMHLSTGISKFDYGTVCCGMTVGGVLGLTVDQYQKINGFPNTFWGWGGEDDAIAARIKKKGMGIRRPSPDLGRFTMLIHEPDKLNPYNKDVYKVLRVSTEKSDEDGLSNLDTKIVQVEQYPTYVKVLVDVGKQR